MCNTSVFKHIYLFTKQKLDLYKIGVTLDIWCSMDVNGTISYTVHHVSYPLNVHKQIIVCDLAS